MHTLVFLIGNDSIGLKIPMKIPLFSMMRGEAGEILSGINLLDRISIFL